MTFFFHEQKNGSSLNFHNNGLILSLFLKQKHPFGFKCFFWSLTVFFIHFHYIEKSGQDLLKKMKSKNK